MLKKQISHTNQIPAPHYIKALITALMKWCLTGNIDKLKGRLASIPNGQITSDPFLNITFKLNGEIKAFPNGPISLAIEEFPLTTQNKDEFTEGLSHILEKYPPGFRANHFRTITEYEKTINAKCAALKVSGKIDEASNLEKKFNIFKTLIRQDTQSIDPNLTGEGLIKYNHDGSTIGSYYVTSTLIGEELVPKPDAQFLIELFDNVTENETRHIGSQSLPILMHIITKFLTELFITFYTQKRTKHIKPSIQNVLTYLNSGKTGLALMHRAKMMSDKTPEIKEILPAWLQEIVNLNYEIKTHPINFAKIKAILLDLKKPLTTLGNETASKKNILDTSEAIQDIFKNPSSESVNNVILNLCLQLYADLSHRDRVINNVTAFLNRLKEHPSLKKDFDAKKSAHPEKTELDILDDCLSNLSDEINPQIRKENIDIIKQVICLLKELDTDPENKTILLRYQANLFMLFLSNNPALTLAIETKPAAAASAPEPKEDQSVGIEGFEHNRFVPSRGPQGNAVAIKLALNPDILAGTAKLFNYAIEEEVLKAFIRGGSEVPETYRKETLVLRTRIESMNYYKSLKDTIQERSKHTQADAPLDLNAMEDSCDSSTYMGELMARGLTQGITASMEGKVGVVPCLSAVYKKSGLLHSRTPKKSHDLLVATITDKKNPIKIHHLPPQFLVNIVRVKQTKIEIQETGVINLSNEASVTCDVSAVTLENDGTVITVKKLTKTSTDETHWIAIDPSSGKTLKIDSLKDPFTFLEKNFSPENDCTNLIYTRSDAKDLMQRQMDSIKILSELLAKKKIDSDIEVDRVGTTRRKPQLIRSRLPSFRGAAGHSDDFDPEQVPTQLQSLGTNTNRKISQLVRTETPEINALTSLLNILVDISTTINQLNLDDENHKNGLIFNLKVIADSFNSLYNVCLKKNNALADQMAEINTIIQQTQRTPPPSIDTIVNTLRTGIAKLLEVLVQNKSLAKPVREHLGPLSKTLIQSKISYYFPEKPEEITAETQTRILEQKHPYANSPSLKDQGYTYVRQNTVDGQHILVIQKTPTDESNRIYAITLDKGKTILPVKSESSSATDVTTRPASECHYSNCPAISDPNFNSFGSPLNGNHIQATLSQVQGPQFKPGTGHSFSEINAFLKLSDQKETIILGQPQEGHRDKFANYINYDPQNNTYERKAMIPSNSDHTVTVNPIIDGGQEYGNSPNIKRLKIRYTDKDGAQQTRIVWHMPNFLDMESIDIDAPINKDYIDFLDWLDQRREKDPELHILSHCSAGLGRSGFISHVLLLLDLTRSNPYQVFDPTFLEDCLEKHRGKRPGSLQTPSQWESAIKMAQQIINNRLTELPI